MRFIPGDGVHYLDRYEVQDGALTLGIANEHGDIVAYVRRADGTHGHCYGGPVYDPPEFTNTCERPCFYGAFKPCGAPCPLTDRDMTEAERRTADALARKVGWMP